MDGEVCPPRHLVGGVVGNLCCRVFQVLGVGHMSIRKKWLAKILDVKEESAESEESDEETQEEEGSDS